MATIDGTLYVCECCAFAIANCDESACLHFYGHEPHAMTAWQAGPLALVGDSEEHLSRFAWLCDGCDQTFIYGSRKFRAEPIRAGVKA